MSPDPFDLDRFLIAQAPVYDMALAELIGGRKLTHWMWFVFPQMRGLGRSSTARLYGIDTLVEARAYLAHPVLGRRLEECTNAVLDCGDNSLNHIFGSPDDMKFCSSMTLFALAANGTPDVFDSALAKFCDGEKDQQTLALLGQNA